MAEKEIRAKLQRAKLVVLEALAKGNLEPVFILVQNGFPVHTPLLDCGVTLMMHAAAVCTGEQFAQLLQLGTDLNAQDRAGRAPIHFASCVGNIGTYKVLVEQETVDIDAVTQGGVTPLMLAVEGGHIKLVVA